MDDREGLLTDRHPASIPVQCAFSGEAPVCLGGHRLQSAVLPLWAQMACRSPGGGGGSSDPAE